MKYLADWPSFWNLITQLWNGCGATLQVFGYTLLFALPLGLVIALGRMSKLAVIRWPVSLYILVMRGTPLILQIFTIYFVLPQIFGHSFQRMTAIVIAFVLNYAAYFAEIYRGGIMGIPDGQREAGKVLGFTRGQTFFFVLLPQVVKKILLPISNEVITLVKDTALITAIGAVELYRAAKNANSASGSLVPLFIAGGFYLIMNAFITGAFSMLIKAFDYYKD